MHKSGDVPCYRFHPVFMSMMALGKLNSVLKQLNFKGQHRHLITYAALCCILIHCRHKTCVQQLFYWNNFRGDKVGSFLQALSLLPRWRVGVRWWSQQPLGCAAASFRLELPWSPDFRSLPLPLNKEWGSAFPQLRSSLEVDSMTWYSLQLGKIVLAECLKARASNSARCLC